MFLAGFLHIDEIVRARDRPQAEAGPSLTRCTSSRSLAPGVPVAENPGCILLHHNSNDGADPWSRATSLQSINVWPALSETTGAASLLS